MEFNIELEEEVDGRWIGAIPTLSGALVYGDTPQEAFQSAIALALSIISDELHHGERKLPDVDPHSDSLDMPSEQIRFTFSLAA
ncbi:MAG: type II toxin-antitoxin system HicB family antitoxin [Myxococcota bacterium]